MTTHVVDDIRETMINGLPAWVVVTVAGKERVAHLLPKLAFIANARQDDRNFELTASHMMMTNFPDAEITWPAKLNKLRVATQLAHEAWIDAEHEHLMNTPGSPSQEGN